MWSCSQAPPTCDSHTPHPFVGQWPFATWGSLSAGSWQHWVSRIPEGPPPSTRGGHPFPQSLGHRGRPPPPHSWSPRCQAGRGVCVSALGEGHRRRGCGFKGEPVGQICSNAAPSRFLLPFGESVFSTAPPLARSKAAKRRAARRGPSLGGQQHGGRALWDDLPPFLRSLPCLSRLRAS